jgi:hypothetical protein
MIILKGNLEKYVGKVYTNLVDDRDQCGALMKTVRNIRIKGNVRNFWGR